jgi:hypothetical protein
MRTSNGKFATPEQIIDAKLRPALQFIIFLILTSTLAWSIQQGAEYARSKHWGQVQADVVHSEPALPAAPESKSTDAPEESTLIEPQPQGSLESEKEQIIQYIVEVFGEHSPDAFNVLFCENRNLNPYATNHNRNGTIDRGIFQLNSAYWGGEENFDWKTNIDKAYMIFERAGKTWRPWTCSHRIGQPNYLQ